MRQRIGEPPQSAVVSACESGVSGRNTRNVDPRPGADSTSVRPPWASVMADTIDRPRPLPPLERAREGSARKKRSKTRWACSGARPGPRVGHLDHRLAVARAARARSPGAPAGRVRARVARAGCPPPGAARTSSPSSTHRALGHQLDRAVRLDHPRVARPARATRRVRSTGRRSMGRPSSRRASSSRSSTSTPMRAASASMRAHRGLEVVGPLGGAAPEQLGVAAHRGERGLQLVGGVAHELAQAPLGLAPLGEGRARCCRASR